jgi:hypothetical protein
MTKEEQAVIAAAIAYGDDDGVDQHNKLCDAVDALRLAREAAPPTIEQLCDTIRTQSMTAGQHRALLMVQRMVHYKRWPASDAREVGELDADIIRDTRNAGPYIWKVWADALRALNIEPVWAKELEV